MQRFFRKRGGRSADNGPHDDGAGQQLSRSRLGILNDRLTDEVPGSVLLMAGPALYNEPLGLQHQHARTSTSSLPSPYLSPHNHRPEPKRTKEGNIILEPQPEDSHNDPLNWTTLRRDAALLSIGFFSMLGGGMTPILAAGFNEVSATFGVSTSRVALTTGLYMMGQGIGNVIMSPTAILYGKRPVYLFGAILFIVSSIWCGVSQSYTSLLLARIFQGIAVSPVECLPSASIAEIFFLHERAYRLGVYTLLLLGGKNIIPLVSAVIIEAKGWRWVFYIVAMVVGFAGVLLFFFVPESFWDRTPKPHNQTKRRKSQWSLHSPLHHRRKSDGQEVPGISLPVEDEPSDLDPLAQRRLNRRVSFAPVDENEKVETHAPTTETENTIDEKTATPTSSASDSRPTTVQDSDRPAGDDPFVSSSKRTNDQNEPGYFTLPAAAPKPARLAPVDTQSSLESGLNRPNTGHSSLSVPETPMHYTKYYREAPAKTYLQTLKPYSGRLSHDKWITAAVRPFLLFAYPAVLWSALLYSLSVGWLIVLSESATVVFKTRYYHFNSLSTGLIYISPFIGGILGTVVAGKVSDIIVRAMARRNDGIYEPEFRLVMVIPVAFATVIGLMGFGWAAQNEDAWIVPTVFFGIISFGCTLGSTTAITFCVDSYRQYAGEALVTLNFSKNIFHGLIFSLFFVDWLKEDGAKDTFLAIGGIQLGLLLFTIPMYIWGKRARMWTVRKNFIEKI